MSLIEDVHAVCECFLCAGSLIKLMLSEPRFFGVARMFEDYPEDFDDDGFTETSEDLFVLDSAISQFKPCEFCSEGSDDERGMWDDMFYMSGDSYECSINWSAESA